MNRYINLSHVKDISIIKSKQNKMHYKIVVKII